MPNYITYKQADSRWGSKNYNGSSSMATAGCGPTSVAMLAYAVDGKTNPWDVAQYMKKHGYAVRNHGTAWDGIPAAMKAFGLQDVKKVNVDRSMDEVWKYLSNGYCAVFLFKAGSKGGITWTTGGHYIAVTDYKIENGKHTLYTRDSGGRNHTGWYCYETQMRGLIPQVWVGKVSGATPKPVPSYAVGIDVSYAQKSIDWAKVKASGINYAVIRAGYGKGNIDDWFKRNIEGAIKAGVEHISVYWFSYAYTDTMAFNEANYCANIIAPWKSRIEYVFFDWEYASMDYAKKQKVTPGRSLITSMTKKFMDQMIALGYKSGFYYNYDYKANHYDMSALIGYAHWYALWSSDRQTDVLIQQYSNKGSVPGISGRVDMNWFIGGTPAPTPAPSGKLKVDGIFGPATKWKLQEWLKVKTDSKIGPKTVRALQKKVGAKIDGKWGPNTTYKLQVFLNKQGANLKTDKKFGPKTIKALQTFLNGDLHPTNKSTTTTTSTVTTKAQKLAAMAKACAWPKGTAKSKYTYPGGSATAEFKAAINKAYPDRSKWGKQTRAGASCDVFSGTCIRASGVDSKFPRGLDEQIPYIKKSDKFTKVDVKSASSLKAGDVIIYTKKSGGGHICIYRGDSLVCEAGYNTKRYGCTVALAKSKFNPTYIKNTYKFFGVYRPKG